MRERFSETISRHLVRAIVTARVPLRIDRASVSFSFDDVPTSAATTGARILEERGVRGSFYVCGELAGGESELYRLASLDEVADLSRAGHEIGCHTARHLSAPRTGLADFLRDVDRNQALLEPVVGRLRTFAYPFGAVALRHKSPLQARFSACRSIHGGVVVGSYDRGRLDAAALEDAAIDERGIDALIDETVRLKGWLTFYSHDVTARPSRIGVTPERLAYAVDAALARGCLVEPVGDVVARNDEVRAGRSAVGR